MRKSIWLFPVGNNEVAITASFDDPEVSFQLVHSVINSYIRWNINTRRVDSQVAQDFFVTLIERHGLALEDARQKLRDYYDANPQPVRGERPISQQLEIAHLQNEIDLASSRYQAALQKEEEANLAMTQIDSEVRHTYELMDAPLLPEKPDISRKKMAMEAGIFLGAGVLLSMIGITGGALLDRSFRFPVDIQTRLSLPVLAIIPAPAQEKWYVRFRFAIFARRGKEKGETAKLVPLQPIKDPSKPVNKPSEQSVDVTV